MIVLRLCRIGFQSSSELVEADIIWCAFCFRKCDITIVPGNKKRLHTPVKVLVQGPPLNSAYLLEWSRKLQNFVFVDCRCLWTLDHSLKVRPSRVFDFEKSFHLCSSGSQKSTSAQGIVLILSPEEDCCTSLICAADAETPGNNKFVYCLVLACWCQFRKGHQ